VGKGSTAGLRAAHAKSIRGLAWVSLAIALAAGALIPATPVGGAIRTFLGWLPWGPVIPMLLLVFGWFGVALDCYVGLKPDRLAVYASLVLPSVASALHGGLAAWTMGVARDVLHGIDQWMFRAQPAGIGSTALALAAAVAAVLMAQRVVTAPSTGTSTRRG
jgi:hypothetical protein